MQRWPCAERQRPRSPSSLCCRCAGHLRLSRHRSGKLEGVPCNWGMATTPENHLSAAAQCNAPCHIQIHQSSKFAVTLRGLHTLFAASLPACCLHPLVFIMCPSTYRQPHRTLHIPNSLSAFRSIPPLTLVAIRVFPCGQVNESKRRHIRVPKALRGRKKRCFPLKMSNVFSTIETLNPVLLVR
jgi:hypothetical protein